MIREKEGACTSKVTHHIWNFVQLHKKSIFVFISTVNVGYCELYFKNGVHYININNDIVSIFRRLIMEIYIFDLISLTKFVPINNTKRKNNELFNVCKYLNVTNLRVTNNNNLVIYLLLFSF